MNLLAREASTIQNPYKFVRLINNRIVLENSDIRAAAITTLGRFAVGKPSMIPEIKSILIRELCDSDTEVRERASYYLEEIKKIENQEDDELDIIQKPLSGDDIDAIEVYLKVIFFIDFSLNHLTKNNIEAIQRTNDINLLSLEYIGKFVKDHNLLSNAQPKEVHVKTASDNFINPEADLRNSSKGVDNLVQKYKQLFKSNEYFSNLGEVKMVVDYKVLHLIIFKTHFLFIECY